MFISVYQSQFFYNSVFSNRKFYFLPAICNWFPEFEFGEIVFELISLCPPFDLGPPFENPLITPEFKSSSPWPRGELLSCTSWWAYNDAISIDGCSVKVGFYSHNLFSVWNYFHLLKTHADRA